MERRDDSPSAAGASSPTEAPGIDGPAPARETLRATPNQHSFEDEEPDDDAARNYHGVEENG